MCSPGHGWGHVVVVGAHVERFLGVRGFCMLHQVGISLYFMMKMHGQTTFKVLGLFGPHHCSLY